MLITTERLILKHIPKNSSNTLNEDWKVYLKTNSTHEIGNIKLSTGGSYAYIVSIHLPIDKGYGKESLSALISNLKNRSKDFHSIRAYASTINSRSNNMFRKLGFTNTKVDNCGSYWDLYL